MIVVYTKRGCPWCEELLAFLSDKKVSFEEKEVRGNALFFEEMVRLSGQEKAPTVVIDGVLYPDTDKEAMQIVLRDSGLIS